MNDSMILSIGAISWGILYLIMVLLLLSFFSAGVY